MADTGALIDATGPEALARRAMGEDRAERALRAGHMLAPKQIGVMLEPDWLLLLVFVSAPLQIPGGGAGGIGVCTFCGPLVFLVFFVFRSPLPSP